jgi:hypothetical protein
MLSFKLHAFMIMGYSVLLQYMYEMCNDRIRIVWPGELGHIYNPTTQEATIWRILD